MLLTAIFKYFLFRQSAWKLWVNIGFAVLSVIVAIIFRAFNLFLIQLILCPMLLVITEKNMKYIVASKERELSTRSKALIGQDESLRE